MLQAIYSRNHGIGSLLIRASSWWGQWSHCGIVTPEGTVIESLAWKGVVETPLSVFMQRATKHSDVVLIHGVDEAAALAFARAQLGKPYDWMGVFAIPLREPWASSRRWFCSKLLEAAAQAGGRQRFRFEPSRITVHQSFMVK